MKVEVINPNIIDISMYPCLKKWFNGSDYSKLIVLFTGVKEGIVLTNVDKYRIGDRYTDFSEESFRILDKDTKVILSN